MEGVHIWPPCEEEAVHLGVEALQVGILVGGEDQGEAAVAVHRLHIGVG